MVYYLEVSDGEFAAVGFDGGQHDLVVFVTLVASKQRLWSSVVCIRFSSQEDLDKT